MTARLAGIVVSHTHWDRAWYLPFQAYRLRLVRLIDSLLTLLEKDPEYRCFTLDGQSVILEDYLNIHPESRSRIAALVNAGRLIIGPWYTLPDLFLSGGEAVIRNLQIGREFCLRFGAVGEVGYVPDPFGHFAQLPQILRGFGIDSFIFMRGMDARTKEEAGAIFRWQAPNGSDVLTVYQPQGYLPCGALGHPAVFGRFEGHIPTIPLAVQRVEEAIAAQSPLQKERTLLLSNGCDHMPPQPELPQMIRGVNAAQETIELIHGTLEDFINAIKREGLPHATVTGDLLGNIDHPILLSVYSARTYLKEQNHQAQSILSRIAEPMRALACRLRVGKDATPFLQLAWRLLLKNHAHDDICGCSVDDVHREDEVCFAEVRQIAGTLVTEFCEDIILAGFEKPAQSGSMSSDVMIFNPHPFAVKATIFPKVLFPNPGGEWAEPTPERSLAAVDGQGKRVPLRVLSSQARTARSAFLETTWGRRYEISAQVELPPLGYSLLHVYETDSLAAPVAMSEEAQYAESADCRLEFSAGLLNLKLTKENRTLPNFLKLEYQLDAGDTYSFGPVEEHGPWYGRLVSARKHVSRPDVLVVRAELEAPENWDRETKSPGKMRKLPLEIELHLVSNATGEAASHLEISIRYENTLCDGRLRLILDAGVADSLVYADSHFRLAQRDVVAHAAPSRSPYPGESSYPTHYCGDYVLIDDNAVCGWVAGRGLHEFEILRSGNLTSIALTLHRSVGSLSVFGGGIRACQAGPQVATPEAQCLRAHSHTVGFGLNLSSKPKAIQNALSFAHPVWVQELPYLPHVKKGGNIPREQGYLSIDNPWIQLAALRSAASGARATAIRLVNLSEQSQSAELSLGFSAKRYCLTSLNETWNEAAASQVNDGKIVVTFGKHEIVTMLVEL